MAKRDIFEEISGRSGKRPSQVLEIPSQSPEKGKSYDSAKVVLRRLTEGSSFATAIVCNPGAITVFPSVQEDPDIFPFIEVLRGNRKRGDVQIRLASEQLQASEIHILSNASAANPKLTIGETLLGSGVPLADLDSVARSVGLDEVLDKSSNTLTSTELARLVLSQALYSRAKVVFVDKIFDEVGSEWIPAIAHAMLQAVSGSNRVIIVQGLTKMPRIWKSSPHVERVSIEKDSVPAVSEETALEAGEYLRKIRSVVGNPGPEQDFIITYPQRIFRRRTPSGSLLMSEIISNPRTTESHVLPDERAMDVHERPTLESSEMAAVVDEIRRPAGGKLTRVSKIERLRNTSTVRLLKRALRGGSNNGQIHTTMNLRVSEAQRREELLLALFILAMLMLGMLSLHWL